MQYTLIRYDTKPGRAAHNRGLVEGVFEELARTRPENLHYLVLELEDGSFAHLFAAPEDGIPSPLSELAAFKAFIASRNDTQAAPAKSATARIVGNYRMLEG